MTWTEEAVAELEAQWRERNACCLQLEKQLRAALKDLSDFCSKIHDTQRANDRALQELHRELGEAASAANQQTLTALLIAPDGDSSADKATKARSPRKKASGRGLAPAPNNQLRGAIERARVRGNRFNVARIKEWIVELEGALRLGEHEKINRGLSGLSAELAK